jgi:hypothetical protein
VCSQSDVHAALEAARYWEKEGNMESAAYFYKEYLASVGLQTDAAVCYKCALILKDIYHYHDAERYLEEIVHSDSLINYPDALFWLGMTKKNNGKYSEAKQSFELYQNEYASDKNPVLQKRVRTELASFDLISRLSTDTLPVKINKVPYPVNTDNSEFNGVQSGEEALYFSSIRQLSTVEYNLVLDDFYTTMIYVAPYTVNGIVEATPLPAVINNLKYNNVNFCFNQDKTKLYFTRNPVGKRKNRYYAVWVSELRNNKWEKPKKLDKIINNPNSNTTQPCFARKDDSDVLFFVSDRKGGFGGMDIWFSRLEGDEFTEPVNLGGSINTPGDEITPFYHTETQSLYFSSDWHEGFGGFDIFKSKDTSGTWEKPVNAGYPLNSSANDIYFTINEVDNDGFLTSNRKGSFFSTDETCCNDIYEYAWTGNGMLIHRDTFFVATKDTIATFINNILPVTLYFHNDEPDPKSNAVTTTKDYKTTLEEYYAMKAIYKQEYARGLQGAEKEKALSDIDTFFTEVVGKGVRHLEELTSYLLEDLQRGNNVDITIIGFASPLHSHDYNENLSLRRIASLKNYIRQQSLFDRYLDTTVEGNKLRFIEDPRGKRFASEFVSDNPNDRRNSVYSIAAALERRIQIVLYKSEKHSDKQESGLLLSKDTIDLQPIADVTHYELYIQIENTGDQPIKTDTIVSDNSLIKASLTKLLIEPDEKTWLCISFPCEIFEKQQRSKIVIRSNTKEQSIYINCNITE